MSEYYVMDMKEFEKLKQANSLLDFEAIALDLYGDPLLFEEVVDDENEFLIHNEDLYFFVFALFGYFLNFLQIKERGCKIKVSMQCFVAD